MGRGIMFSLEQKVVYPGCGVAEVCQIFEKTFGATSTVFYKLRLLSKELKEATVLVSIDKIDELGIRPLSSTEHISTMLGTLTTPVRKIHQQELTASNWNRRNKEYQNKLRTGSLKDISEIYRDLKYISQHKELSFGEKSLLSKTESLLVEEISAAEQLAEDKAIERLRSFFVPFMAQSQQRL